MGGEERENRKGRVWIRFSVTMCLRSLFQRKNISSVKLNGTVQRKWAKTEWRPFIRAAQQCGPISPPIATPRKQIYTHSHYLSAHFQGGRSGQPRLRLTSHAEEVIRQQLAAFQRTGRYCYHSQWSALLPRRRRTAPHGRFQARALRGHFITREKFINDNKLLY